MVKNFTQLFIADHWDLRSQQAWWMHS